MGHETGLPHFILGNLCKQLLHELSIRLVLPKAHRTYSEKGSSYLLWIKTGNWEIRLDNPISKRTKA